MYLLTLRAVEINSLPHLLPLGAAVFHLPYRLRHYEPGGDSAANIIAETRANIRDCKEFNATIALGTGVDLPTFPG
jgi:hypothetical protein